MLRKLKIESYPKDSIPVIKAIEPKFSMPHDKDGNPVSLITNTSHLVNPDGSNYEELYNLAMDYTEKKINQAVIEKQKELIFKLRELTGCGLIDGRKALCECEWDIDKTIEYLKNKPAIRGI